MSMSCWLQQRRDSRAIDAVDRGQKLDPLLLAQLLGSLPEFVRMVFADPRAQLAADLASHIDSHPDFERMAPVPFSVVCFRWRPAGQRSRC